MTTWESVIESGENMSWCRPYVSDDEKYAVSVNEGDSVGLLIDGKEVEINADNLHRLAIAVNENYNDYGDGWNDLEIALASDKLKECGCRDCPWFDYCEAMSDNY